MQDSDSFSHAWLGALVCALALGCAPESSDPVASPAYERALEHTQAGRLDEAEAELSAAIRAAPEEVDPHLLRGAIVERRGRLEEAADSYREAQRIDPTHPSPPLHLERIAGKIRLDAQIRAAEGALPNAEEPGEAHLELGDLYAKRLLSEPAKHHYTLALRHDPNDARAHAGMAVVMIGVRRQVVGLHHATEALRISPGNPRALGELIWVLATSSDETLRDPEEAIRLALETPVKTTRILDALAAAYAHAGRPEQATETADAAIEQATREGNHVVAHAIRARRAVFGRGGLFVGPPLDPT